jgi:hypothetical protein
MAKSSKTERNERQRVVEQMRAQQKRAERRRGMIVVVACIAVAVLIVGAAAWQPIHDSLQKSKYDGKPLAEIGAAASVCGDVTTKKANGNQKHLADGSTVVYPDSPPAFGPHYVDPDAMDRKFYTAADRPDLGTLVHNEEHGYTILWYDDTVAGDDAQMTQIRAIADKFSGTSDLRHKFKAVPWTAKDGAPFPDGQHVALTHWSVGGTTDAAAGSAKQVGVWQYCSEVSGAGVEAFTIKYPYSDSPEPNGM